MAEFTIAFALVILAIGICRYLFARADQIDQDTEIAFTKFNNGVRIYNAQHQKESKRVNND